MNCKVRFLGLHELNGESEGHKINPHNIAAFFASEKVHQKVVSIAYRYLQL